VGYHIRKKTYTTNIFLPRNGPPSLGYLNKNKTMKPLGGGDFEMATPPATTTTNHFHGGRNLCLTPF